MLRNEKGLTLIESLGAMALLGIVVAAFLATSSYVVHSNKQNDKAAAALLVAEEQLSTAKALIQAHQPYSTSPVAPGFQVTLQETEWNAPAAYISTPAAGSRSVSVQSVIWRPSDARTKLLTCTVTWR